MPKPSKKRKTKADEEEEGEVEDAVERVAYGDILRHVHEVDTSLKTHAPAYAGRSLHEEDEGMLTEDEHAVTDSCYRHSLQALRCGGPAKTYFAAPFDSAPTQNAVLMHTVDAYLDIERVASSPDPGTFVTVGGAEYTVEFTERNGYSVGGSRLKRVHPYREDRRGSFTFVYSLCEPLPWIELVGVNNKILTVGEKFPTSFRIQVHFGSKFKVVFVQFVDDKGVIRGSEAVSIDGIGVADMSDIEVKHAGHITPVYSLGAATRTWGMPFMASEKIGE